MSFADRRTFAAPQRIRAHRDRRSWPARLFTWLIVWNERHRERCQLNELDDRALRDMGLSRDQVEAESRKPFWQP